MANENDKVPTLYEIDEMLKQSIENTNRLTKHIEALWIEIGEKQTAYYDIKYELSTLKTDHKELLQECRQKNKSISKAQFQKEWLEHCDPMKTDN